MKLGVFSMPLGDRSFEEALKFIRSIGAEAVEIGSGGFNPKFHADPSVLLNDKSAMNTFTSLIEKY